ncbi:MAG TPA: hypothetical protein PKA06_03730 [Gemmatales bacterium]|nr:hypothetical protein [Gemmatales bacterium]
MIWLPSSGGGPRVEPTAGHFNATTAILALEPRPSAVWRGSYFLEPGAAKTTRALCKNHGKGMRLLLIGIARQQWSGLS